MSAAKVVPIATRAKVLRRHKASNPDVDLLTSAAELLGFADVVYEFASESDIHRVVRTARDQVELWCSENEELNFSQHLYSSLAVLMLTDAFLEAALAGHSSIVEPVRGGVSAAKGLLRRAIRKPTE